MHKYQIKIPHFYCLEYLEDNKIMTLDIDFRDPIIYLNTSLITKWNQPQQNDPIDNQNKVEIINNIYEYLVNIRGFKNIQLE